LQKIANKDSDREGANNAFALFVGYFESKIKPFVEIYANKIGFNDNVAFEAIQGTFNKVWHYPTFDINKSHSKNKEKSIIIWLESIAYSQIYQYIKKGECAKIKDDEDLPIIETSNDFITLHIPDLSPDKKEELVQAFNKRLSVLDKKHRIIYLTYKAYQTRGKKLPRTVLKKLRIRLGISQSTVRVYKKQSCEQLKDLELLKV
jgi:hypothetical protein